MTLVFHRAKLDKLESLIGLFSTLRNKKLEHLFGINDVFVVLDFVVYT